MMRLKLYAAMLVVLMVNSCANEPQDDGQCALSCDGAKFAGVQSSYEITYLGDGDALNWEFNCYQDQEFTVEPDINVRPYKYRYVISKMHDRPRVPAVLDGKDEDEDEFRMGLQIDLRPISGIAFTPVVTGDVSIHKTHPDNAVIEGNTANPIDYAGVVTPKSEWCSDSCGVATLEVWPKCFGGAKQQIYITSGTVFSPTITTEISGETALVNIKETDQAESNETEDGTN